MSTLRYSGDIIIQVTYLEPTFESPPPADKTNKVPHGEYRCFLKLRNTLGRQRTVIYVSAMLEHGSGIGVASPEAFDNAARVSILFADNENPDWGKRCAYNPNSSIHVGRSSWQRHGKL